MRFRGMCHQLDLLPPDDNVIATISSELGQCDLLHLGNARKDALQKVALGIDSEDLRSCLLEDSDVAKLLQPF